MGSPGVHGVVPGTCCQDAVQVPMASGRWSPGPVLCVRSLFPADWWESFGRLNRNSEQPPPPRGAVRAGESGWEAAAGLRGALQVAGRRHPFAPKTSQSQRGPKGEYEWETGRGRTGSFRRSCIRQSYSLPMHAFCFDIFQRYLHSIVLWCHSWRALHHESLYPLYRSVAYCCSFFFGGWGWVLGWVVGRSILASCVQFSLFGCWSELIPFTFANIFLGFLVPV